MKNNQKSILLVEDEVIVGIEETAELENYGYLVTHVVSGLEAVEKAVDRKSVIDMILMDINLGNGIDGTEAAKIILKERDLPIVFLSSHTEQDMVDKTENITSYGYVVKNSGITVLDASIKMAFCLFEAFVNEKKHRKEIEDNKLELASLEKRYRRLFESARDGILILNAASGLIVDVNPYLIEMLGYSKEEFLNKKIWDIGAFKNIDYFKQVFKELQEKEYIRYMDIPLETSTGHQIYVEFVSNVYLADNEKVIQCNVRDITVRRAYEENLTTSIESQKYLLKEIQHRAKNSFNMIMSLIQLRQNKTQSEETTETLKELSYRIKSISDLYSQLYETSSFYDVQLKTYCSKVIETMVNLSKNVTVSQSFEEITVPEKYAATLGMILVELLTNAIKYAFPDSQNGFIKIELKKLDSKIFLTVEDNGIGLEKDFDIAKTKSMGLHLVSLMVSQLNGNFKYFSENGTKIVIECPV